MLRNKFENTVNMFIEEAKAMGFIVEVPEETMNDAFDIFESGDVVTSALDIFELFKNENIDGDFTIAGLLLIDKLKSLLKQFEEA